MPQRAGLRASRAGVGDTRRAVPEPRADGQTGSVTRAWPAAELPGRWSVLDPISAPLGHPVLPITDDM